MKVVLVKLTDATCNTATDPPRTTRFPTFAPAAEQLTKRLDAISTIASFEPAASTATAPPMLFAIESTRWINKLLISPLEEPLVNTQTLQFEKFESRILKLRKAGLFIHTAPPLPLAAPEFTDVECVVALQPKKFEFKTRTVKLNPKFFAIFRDDVGCPEKTCEACTMETAPPKTFEVSKEPPEVPIVKEEASQRENTLDSREM
jgi:hypothetical protein